MGSELPSCIPGEQSSCSLAVLIVHSKIVAEGAAASVKNAKVKASQHALDELKGMAPIDFRRQYDCDCSGETKAWVGQDGAGVGMVGIRPGEV